MLRALVDGLRSLRLQLHLRTRFLRLRAPLALARLKQAVLLGGLLMRPSSSPESASPGQLLESLPPFAHATVCTGSSAGMGGVLFLQWPAGQIVVLKALPDVAEAVTEIAATNLCKRAAVQCPAIEALSLHGRTGRALRKRVRELVDASPDASERLER